MIRLPIQPRAALLMTFALVACGDEVRPTGEVDAGAPAPADAAPPADATVEPSDLADAARPAPADAADPGSPTAIRAGVYAIRTVVSTVDQTPAGEQHTTGYSYGIAVLGEASGGYSITETFCRMEIENDGLLELHMTDETVRAIPTVTVPVTIEQRAAGLTLYRPVHPVPLGAVLDDPIAEPLPISADDPRVVDHEGDGHPGMSVHFSGLFNGSIYAVRREVFDYTVVAQPGGRLEGHTIDRGEQQIIGASNPLFVQNTESRQNPNLALSPVTLIPLATELDCDALVEQLDELFPR